MVHCEQLTRSIVRVVLVLQRANMGVADILIFAVVNSFTYDASASDGPYG